MLFVPTPRRLHRPHGPLAATPLLLLATAAAAFTTAAAQDPSGFEHLRAGRYDEAVRALRSQARDGNAAWVMIDATGPLPMELTESEPPTRLVTTILSEGMPFGGRWIYEIEPAAAGATVTITEEGEVYSAVFRFVSRYIMGHHASASLFLTDLGARFDENVTVDVVR